MSSAQWLAFLSYAVITAITPGPNNILALSATSRNGIRKSKGLLLGIYSGFLCVMALCCAFCAALTTVLPAVTIWLSYLGAVYILWLAWHIAASKPPAQAVEGAHTASFWKGFFLQFINVKIILWGLSVFAGYILPHGFTSLALVGFVVLTASIGGCGTLLWAFAGAALSGFLQRYWRAASVVMALCLAASAVGLLLP